MNKKILNAPIDTVGILKTQRNKYPLLFIDKIIKIIPGKEAIGVKNFTYNEWYFPSHFDDEPNVPGFIQIECLVQTFLMTFLTLQVMINNLENLHHQIWQAVI